MSENNSATNSSNNSNWVCLNVGGKTFQTTKDTLSRYSDSFLACLVNSDLPSEKDEKGAFLIDRDPKQFRVILNYLRSGVLHMDRNETAMNELLCEADFYGLHALIEQIKKPVSGKIEIICLHIEYHDDRFTGDTCNIYCSEERDDYEVLQAFRDKFPDIRGENGVYGFSRSRFSVYGSHILEPTRIEIETLLHNYGFDEKSFDIDNKLTANGDRYRTKSWKFIRTVSK